MGVEVLEDSLRFTKVAYFRRCALLTQIFSSSQTSAYVRNTIVLSWMLAFTKANWSNIEDATYEIGLFRVNLVRVEAEFVVWLVRMIFIFILY
jgi:hypothetical protein